MKRLFFLGVIFQFTLACSNQVKFPEMVTQPVIKNGEEIYAEKEIGAGEKVFQNGNVEIQTDLQLLISFHQKYFQKNEEFDLENFITNWEKFHQSTRLSQLNQQEVIHFFQMTGFLFQLTGEAKFAEEMEEIAWESFRNKPQFFDSLISPYIFTKNVDHIHVNLFLPAEISYEHTLGGAVKIMQETDFPESGSIRLNFSMEIKRYIEVFVRIPAWAEGASVTVKGVKYFAQPGEYCIIAKKWKEDDVIEIEFPLGNLPDYLKPQTHKKTTETCV